MYYLVIQHVIYMVVTTQLLKFFFMSSIKDKSISKSVYCINKANLSQMKYSLVNFPWHSCFDYDIDIMWNRVETFIKSCIDNSVPKKVVKKNKDLPWMN